MASTNGRARRGENKVRVAIVGVGNCANSLLQGVEYYKDADPDEFVPGLMHVDLGGYHVRDIEFSAAFDVTAGKVGKDLSEAIWAEPNDTIKFSDVPKTGVTVSRGMTHDGLGKYLSQVVEKAAGADGRRRRHPAGDRDRRRRQLPARRLRGGDEVVRGADPPGRLRDGELHARLHRQGRPLPAALRGRWPADHRRRHQVAGRRHDHAPRAHHLLRERGVRLDKTMQLNVGGNSDFLNMLERERLESKKISKTNAVTAMLDYDIGEQNIHVGPCDHVPWLTDRKWAYIRMEGSSFGDVPLNIELKLEVWDSPNSAGIVIDAVRLAKLALNNGVAGALEGPSAYLMKSPPKQMPDDDAHAAVERFIKQYTRTKAKAPAKA